MSRSVKIVFATCAAAPDYQESDRLAAEILGSKGGAQGYDVAPAPWNGPMTPFREGDLTVIRSTWDYWKSAAAFDDWLAALDPARTINPPSLMRWNLNKRYLLELREKGAPTPDLRVVAPSAEALQAAIRDLGLASAVVKPVVSAGGDGLVILGRDDHDTATETVAGWDCDFIVQPLIPEIRTSGETSLIFFDGAFSHAVNKTPRDGTVLCQAEHGGRIALIDPDQELAALGARILSMLPEKPLYARVDLILGDSGPLLMEVEAIEPELFLTSAPGSAERFAQAIAKRVDGYC